MDNMDNFAMQADGTNPSSSLSVYNKLEQRHWLCMDIIMARTTGEDMDRRTVDGVLSALDMYFSFLPSNAVADIQDADCDMEQHFREHPELISSFREALLNRDFDNFMRDYHTAKKEHPPTPQGPPPFLVNSFQRPYLGQAAEALVEYLTDVNKLVKGKGHGQYYGKILSIVQASGTGKTRMVLELFKHNVLVVYICVRDSIEILNLPPRDTIIADLLQRGRPCSGEEYLTRCYLVLAALFKTLHEWIGKARDQGWEALLGLHAIQERETFFHDVSDNYEALSFSSKAEPYDPELQYASAREIMRAKYYGLLDQYTLHFPTENPDAPQIVFAFDEAHTFTENFDWGNIDQAHYLCRALSDVPASFGLVWFLFVSTQAEMFRPPKSAPIRSELRVPIKGDQLVTPFTLTGWDQFAPLTADPGVPDIDNVARFEHLKGYGRPLWNSGYNVDAAKQLAERKLVCATRFSATKDNQALAVLGQRFVLDLIPGCAGALEFLDLATACHMRICMSISDDRSWRFTSYPSEPVLSNAAASLLHQDSANVVECLKVLNAKIDIGMVENGGRGELVSRLLLLLGRDYTPTTERMRSVSDSLSYCRPVKVLDYLKTTFGDYFEDAPTQDAFEHAYINFSHWLSMKDHSAKPNYDSSEAAIKHNNQHYFGSKDLLLDMWTRTAAFQCAHTQADADKVVPIYFDLPNVPAIDRVSHMLDSDTLQAHRNPKPVRLQTNLPTISVTCDMGLIPGPPEVLYENNVLRIHVKGVARVSFPFMSEGVEKEMAKMVYSVTHPTIRYPIGAEVAVEMQNLSLLVIPSLEV